MTLKSCYKEGRGSASLEIVVNLDNNSTEYQVTDARSGNYATESYSTLEAAHKAYNRLEHFIEHGERKMASDDWPTHIITVREDLAASYWVKAPTAEAAEELIREKYERGEIYLDASDYVDNSGEVEYTAQDNFTPGEPHYIYGE